MYFPIATGTMLVFLLAAIGVVSSFGNTADVGGSSSSSALQRNRQQQQNLFGLHNRQQRSQPITSTALTSSLTSAPGTTTHTAATQSPLFRNGPTPLSRASSSLSASPQFFTAEQESSTIPEGEIKGKRSLLRRILWNANPLAGRKDDRWKGGETTATLASRLVFSYVSPLLDIVADTNDKITNRTLTEEDAFAINEQRSMNFAVESLASTYDSTRTKARRQLEEKRQDSDGSENNRKVKNSESLILLKAMIKDQKSALLLTGVLRFINTIVQAFPSLLVARLLRAIEAGPSSPIQESLKASVLLVGVLGLKMILENQYFHNVVNMSTQIRGTMEGLIFDKSLRLPEGGSGVLTKVDTGDISTQKKRALGSGGVSSCVFRYYDVDFLYSRILEIAPCYQYMDDVV